MLTPGWDKMRCLYRLDVSPDTSCCILHTLYVNCGQRRFVLLFAGNVYTFIYNAQCEIK